MGERENAMAQGTSLVPYSETQRDLLEQQLADDANKREINRRAGNGITVVAYWLMRERVALIYVHDTRTNSASEFEVPPAEVMEHFIHPFANPNTFDMGIYKQSENDGA